MPKVAAIIVAAGTGERYKKTEKNQGDESIPKQYQKVGEKTVLYHATKPFCDHPDISHVICAINTAHSTMYYASQKGLNLEKPVPGGKTRQSSVCEALEYLDETVKPDYVIIHDGARPFITKRNIDLILKAFTDGETAVSLGQQASDTFRRGVFRNRICYAGEYVERENLFALQTPQGFEFEALLDAHQRTIKNNHTDDTALISHYGHEVALIEGDILNIKITTAYDLEIARRLLHK